MNSAVTDAGVATDGQEQASPLPTKPLFSLTDAVSLYQKQVDDTHRFWNYFWLVSSAMLTAVGLSANIATGTAGRDLWIYLLVAFAAFAVVNAFLMWFAHQDARQTALAIRSYVARKDIASQLDQDFRHLMDRFSRFPAIWPLLGHLAMDAFVTASIWQLGTGAPIWT